MGKGWGLETRELQHSSRDTISERWGERLHSKTQAQPRLHPPLSPLPGSFSRPSGRELGTRPVIQRWRTFFQRNCYILPEIYNVHGSQ